MLVPVVKGKTICILICVSVWKLFTHFPFFLWSRHARRFFVFNCLLSALVCALIVCSRLGRYEGKIENGMVWYEMGWANICLVKQAMFGWHMDMEFPGFCTKTLYFCPISLQFPGRFGSVRRQGLPANWTGYLAYSRQDHWHRWGTLLLQKPQLQVSNHIRYLSKVALSLYFLNL